MAGERMSKTRNRMHFTTVQAKSRKRPFARRVRSRDRSAASSSTCSLPFTTPNSHTCRRFAPVSLRCGSHSAFCLGILQVPSYACNSNVVYLRLHVDRLGSDTA
jgi:hypothetical protein